MGYFRNNNLDLGEIKGGKTHSMIFDYVGDPNIKVISTKASCGCTSSSTAGNNVIAKVYVDPIPYHLRSQGYYNFSKTISVRLSNGDVEVLTFKAKVV